MSKSNAYSLFIVSVFLMGCTKDLGKINRGDYPDDIGKIITLKCAVSGCHNSQSYQASADFDLSSWQTMFKGSNNGSPVIPYNSDFSSLCYFINTYPELGLRNTPVMPLNQSPLSLEEVKKVKDWIDRGAPSLSGAVYGSDPNLSKLYAVNQGCDVVTVLEAETQLPIRYVKVGNKPNGNTPHQVHVSPDGKYWYVIFLTTNILQKFDCSTDRLISNIPLTPFAANGSGPDAFDWNTFVISGDGRYAYCSSLAANGWISKVDLKNGTLVKYMPGLSYPHGIVLSKDNSKLYVTSQYGNTLNEIDTALNSVKKYTLDGQFPNSIPNTIDPHELVLSGDGNRLFITCQSTNDVRVFDLLAQSVVQTIPTGFFPQEIMYSAQRNQYFVSCTSDDKLFPKSMGVISRIDGQSYAVDNIPCGYQPHGMAVDDKHNLLHVLSRNVASSGPLPHHTSKCAGRNGFINFVDLNTFRVLPKKYELSVDPYYIALRP